MHAIAKEWTVAWRDGRARWLLAVLGGLLLAAALVQAMAVRGQVAAVAAASAAEYARWLAQPPKNAHSAGHYGIWTFRPPAPLAVADPGITPHVGGALWMEAHYQNEPLHRPAQDAGLLERFGALTPASVIGALVPLFAVLLGFGLVAAEREQGTWAMARVQAGGLGRLYAAKSLALGGGLLLALAPGLVVVALAVPLTTAAVVGVAPDDLALRLVAWLAAVIAYVLAVAALVVALSAVSRSAALALGLGLAAWVALALGAPRLAGAVAERAAPLPTQQAHDARLRTALGDPQGDAAIRELQAQVLRRYGVERVEDLPINIVGVRLQAGEERANGIFDRYWGEVYDRVERQQALGRLAGFVSPWLAFRSLSQELAGSDFGTHRAFLAQAEAHRRETQRLLNDVVAANPARGGGPHVAGRETWSRVPEFRPVVPALPADRAWRVPALQLLFWSALAVALLVGLAHRQRRRPA